MNKTKPSHPPRIFAFLAVMIVLSLTALLIGRWQSDVRNAGVSESNVQLSSTADGTAQSNTKNSGVMVLNQLPPFALTNQDGIEFGARELQGKIWVANFIFTKCKSMCPMLTNQMRTLQAQLLENNIRDTHFVSISVDPINDSPQVLKAYAQSYKIDFNQWAFLTGSRDVIYELSKNGFKLAVSEDPSNQDMPILHTNMFALVDRDFTLRGFYDPSTDNGRQKLLRDIQRVLAEKQVAHTESGAQVTR